MSAIRNNEKQDGSWICDTVSDLTNVPKLHGTEAYIISEVVWARYNAYTGLWVHMMTGMTVVAGMDPNDA